MFFRGEGIETALCPYSGILLSNKKEQTTDTPNLDESQRHLSE